MKEANLLSIISAHRTLSPALFDSYLKYHGINIRPQELIDLKVLVSEFSRKRSIPISAFDKYFVGYKIPQIGKEFDLLRIDDKSIVNIEIKKISTKDKMKAQLERNNYYLSFLRREMNIFSFVANEKKFYTLNNRGRLIEAGIQDVLACLISQKVEKLENIDSYFNPTNYLISPFNSTKEFMEGNYFLTTHQEFIKKEILKLLDTPKYTIASIKGKAGTGKTLLTYNIAKDVNLKKETLIVHCGILNEGHIILRDEYEWDIIAIKDLMKKGSLSKYHLIIVDEAQRIIPSQLDHIIAEVQAARNNCILSHDPEQTLKRQEIHNNIEVKINAAVTIPTFELTNKIRTNKEVASFIQSLVDSSRPLDKYNFANIEVNYFDNYDTAKTFLHQLGLENWKLINYTPSQYSIMPYDIHNIQDETDTAHTVIGQEFDNVVAVIDEHFVYKESRLSTHRYGKRPVYHPTKMLFQIASRAKIKLGVVIIKNPDVLKRCIEILTP